ncbi:hypothetical protein JK635_07830 [Neobacillus sp. YIM B02564]|uniref:DUF4352 domain-containing protein n=1 Tax=Neobacillus paridis TaxID=2803862 RepID=A0ABS1TLB9_9BACI|nr:hypothetical protein [Neobacillus paridis]MBL4952119.1 hypothetical protein [Neobacillus paridis]
MARRRKRGVLNQKETDISLESIAENLKNEMEKEDTPNEISNQPLNETSKIEKETYPNPLEEERKLLKKAEAFLQKNQVKLSLDEGKEKEEATEVKQESELLKEEPKRIIPQTKQNQSFYFAMIGIVLTLIGFVFGILVSITHQQSAETHRISPLENIVKQDLSLHNVKKEASMYGVSLKIVKEKKRENKWMVAFEVQNQGKETVYFMANTLKLVGEDGTIIVPELDKGNIPPTFAGNGIAPGTSDQAVLVFTLPHSFQPDYFLLENVTNMKNGTWTFQIDAR